MQTQNPQYLNRPATSVVPHYQTSGMPTNYRASYPMRMQYQGGFQPQIRHQSGFHAPVKQNVGGRPYSCFANVIPFVAAPLILGFTLLFLATLPYGGFNSTLLSDDSWGWRGESSSWPFWLLVGNAAGFFAATIPIMFITSSRRKWILLTVGISQIVAGAICYV